MEVTTGPTLRWALELSRVFSDHKRQENLTGVASTQIFAARCFRDPRYLPGDGKNKECRRLRPREACVQFRCVHPRSRADYRKQKLLHTVTLRSFKARA